MTIPPPQATEFGSFYAGYIGQVGPNGPEAMLRNQVTAFAALRALPDDRANHRYADGKWTVKEVIGHISDTERVFAFRLLRSARADETPLPGFDENAWAAAAPHSGRPLADVVDEMIAVRHSTLALMGSLDEAALTRTVPANNTPISVRAICWIAAGHAEHHLGILSERYGVKV